MITFICFMFLHFNVVYGYTLPTVNLTSCIHNTVTVKIENTPEGGIAYFRTDTAYNIVQTTGGTLVHECKFEECNINWDEKFHVIVQRYVYIQTHHDVIIWFICNTDFGAIQPLDIDFLGNEDSNFTLVKYKPEVSLMLYKGAARLDSGGAVKLGDELTMIMTVTNNVNDYFDISAKACYASGIILVEDHCPVDENLFGLFNSTGHGYLVNTFGMFRPTNIAGGPTEVVFTCILEVCMWNCQEKNCSSVTNDTSRRRKRDADDDETIDDDVDIPNIIRGYKVVALADGEEITTVSEEETETDLCVPLYLIVAIAGVSLTIIGGGVTVFTSGFRNFLDHNKTIAKLRKTNDTKLNEGSGHNDVGGVAVLSKGNIHLSAAPSPYRRKSLTNL